MSVAKAIEDRLRAALAPETLEIRNDSDRHRGHAGHDGSGESHFHVKIVSSVFEGKGRIERQRMVHTLLKDLLESRIHALSLRLLTPAEESSAKG